MGTSLVAIFKLVFGGFDFVLVIDNRHGRKIWFSANNQTSIDEKSSFSHFEVIFFNV